MNPHRHVGNIQYTVKICLPQLEPSPRRAIGLDCRWALPMMHRAPPLSLSICMHSYPIYSRYHHDISCSFELSRLQSFCFLQEFLPPESELYVSGCFFSCSTLCNATITKLGRTTRAVTALSLPVWNVLFSWPVFMLRSDFRIIPCH